jgi:hypothetical protein
MPTKDGFRLEDADDILELSCRFLGNLFPFSGQNSRVSFSTRVGLIG